MYSPPGAPERKGDLFVPGNHRDTIIVLVHGGDGTTGSRRQMRLGRLLRRGGLRHAVDRLPPRKDEHAAAGVPEPRADVKAAVQYLRMHAATLGIDPDRIVVQGLRRRRARRQVASRRRRRVVRG